MHRTYLMVAPNGARQTKRDHPALPTTIAETVATATACHAAGADALHLHVRDNQGRHTLDAGLYSEALAELARAVPSMRIQVSTEAAGVFDVGAQLACLTTLRPAWASISVREIARSPDMAETVYAMCSDLGTEVQHILYDTTDIALLKNWQDQGIIRPEQKNVIFVLGRYSAGQTSSPGDLVPLRTALPQDGNWMVCAFGAQEHACLAAAAAQGGAVRVGFENSIHASDGTHHTDNASSVTMLRRTLEGQIK